MSAQPNRDPPNQLVINWHITEPCNFSCRYCYAHWNTSKAAHETWRQPEEVSRLLRELMAMPSIAEGDWTTRPRLNIAGGEPLLLWNKGFLPRILDEAEFLGFDLSIITNGFLLTAKVVRELAPRLQILGISMDSANPDTNKKIGRCSKKSEQITPDQIQAIFQLARNIHPAIECKLNTVVCSHNWQENLISTISQISPDRWKVFQMLPVSGTPESAEKQKSLIISNQQFEAFKARHAEIEAIRPENNEEMTESYVMVNPMGRFYQNTSDSDKYTYSDPIHQIGAKEAWKKVNLDAKKFCDRYEQELIPLKHEMP